MSKYFNKTKGSVSASLLNGSSAIFPPKSWVSIDDSFDSSPSLLRLLDKGFLHRQLSALPISIEIPVQPIEEKKETIDFDVSTNTVIESHLEVLNIENNDVDSEKEPKLRKKVSKES